MSGLEKSGVEALRAYFEDRDGVMRALLDRLKRYEQAIAEARETLESIEASTEHTPLELSKKAKKALEKLVGGGARVMRDEELRELERRTLSGDREALGRLKMEWLRMHDAQPALDALINKTPESNPKGGVMFAEVRAVYFVEDVESAIPKWERIKSTVTFVTRPYPQFRPVDHPWLDPIDETRLETRLEGDAP